MNFQPNALVRSRRAVTLAGVLALLLCHLSSPRAARGEDEPAGHPKAQPKVVHPFLDGLVGSWDVTMKAGGAEMKGGVRYGKEVDGTALLEDLHVGEGAAAFYGLGVMRPSEDGKTLKSWWFDTQGKGGMWPFEGPLTETGYDLKGDMAGTAATVSLHKKGSGYEFTMKVADKVAATATYAKSAKERPWSREAKATGKEPAIVQAELGDWTVEGSVMGQPHAGEAWFRLGLGGAYVLGGFEASGHGPTRASFTVSAVAADGKTMRTWAFGNYLPDPLVLEGAFAEGSWEGKGSTSMGDIRVELKKADAGLTSATWFGSGSDAMQSGTETYTRKAAPGK